MKLRIAAALVLAVAGMALWVVNCSGPRPEVVEKMLIEPVGLNESYSVQFMMRDSSGERAYRAEQKIELEGGDNILATVEIPAPPGAYDLEVNVSYPP